MKLLQLNGEYVKYSSNPNPQQFANELQLFSLTHHLLLKYTYIYIRLHVSAPWSHHQASTVEQVQI